MPSSNAWVESLGWMLIHSVWLISVIVGVAAVGLRLSRRRSANARYLVGCIALLLSVSVLPVVFVWVTAQRHAMPQPVVVNEKVMAVNAGDRIAWDGAGQSFRIDADPDVAPQPVMPEPQRTTDEGQRTTPTEVVRLDESANRSAVEEPMTWQRLEARLRPHLTWLVSGWLAGVCLLSVRPLIGWHSARRLQQVGLSKVSDSLQEMLSRLAGRLGLKRAVRLFQSSLVQIPCVVGAFKPVILLPASAIIGLSPDQLEALLAHELAHIRRHDFAVNVVQTLVETLLFYHPAIWWLSHRVRQEREHCCDDMAISVCGDVAGYARMLVSVEGLRGRVPQASVAASGGSLVERIRRLVPSSQEQPRSPWLSGVIVLGTLVVLAGSWQWTVGQVSNLPKEEIVEDKTVSDVPAQAAEQVENLPHKDWPQWGRSSHRNNVADGRLPLEWNLEKGTNVVWRATLGSETYSSPIVSEGKVFIGTNNQGALNPAHPKDKDMSCLVCFDQATGKLLWQYASEKLPAGRSSDWPNIGLCSTACADGDRVWVVTNRCEVVCLDANGFRDGENDGPFREEPAQTEIDADVVWKFDMFGELGVRPLHQSVSSITQVDGVLLLNTSNGPDESHKNVPAPHAPNFLALEAKSGRVIWKDNSAGESIVIGGSSCSCSGASPSVATLGGVTQAIFTGKEGWVYSYDFNDLKIGKTTLLWKFDCNPKASMYLLGSRSRRHPLVASPVVAEGRVYVATGKNPEHGDGEADLWCIDPTKRGDISTELVFNKSFENGEQPIPHNPFRACETDKGDFVRPNPNSGAIWNYSKADRNGDGKIAFEETFHCSLGSPVIHGGLLFIADFSGMMHCLDSKTGEVLWTHDLLAAVWSSCVIADDHVLIGDEDGDVEIFKAARTKQSVFGDTPQNFSTSAYATPVLVAGTLFVAAKNTLVAIRDPKQDEQRVNNANGDLRSNPAAGSGDPRRAQESDWGPTTNGLRARVVPVLSSMSADAIDPAQRVTKFVKADDIALVVELENVSDKPVKMVDLWHDAKNGKPIQDADWLSQLVCSVVLFDRDGKLIEQPEIEVVDIISYLLDAQIATLQPGKRQLFLIKPTQWLAALKPPIQAGSYRVAVRYHWLSSQNQALIRETFPKNERFVKSPLLEAAAVNVVSAAVAIEVGGESRKADLVWSNANNGLRAAVSFEPSKAKYAHDEKLDVKLHLQNVGKQPLKLTSPLDPWFASATIKNDKGKRVEFVDDSIGRTSGYLPGLLTLKPQQIVVLDAANLGLAITEERANQFDDRTLRKLIAPAGKYSMQLTMPFDNVVNARAYEGQDMVVVKDAWVGKLTTGAAPLVITAAPVVGVRGEVEDKPAEIGAFVQINPPPVVGDFSKVDNPDVLLDQLAKSQLPSLVPQTGGGFFHQPGAPPQAMFVTIWESQYARDDKLDPRIRRLIELGDRAVPRVHQRLNGLAASDLLAAHLTLVLRSAGGTESVPVLIKLLKTTPNTVLDGTQSIDHELKGSQASVTQIAVTSALWTLTGRKHIFTPDQWEKWWQSVKPDFVVLRERKRPEFVLRVTPERVTAVANELAKDEVAARERLIAMGSLAVPELLKLMALTEGLRELTTAAKADATLRRLAWVIDELGATDKVPARLRREYFAQRFSDDGTYPGLYPIDEDALCRALSHCSFADYCSIFLEADSQAVVAPHMTHLKWPMEIYAAYSRRFSKLSPPNLGGWTNNPHWSKVVPAEDPAGEIASAVPMLVAALKDERVERRASASKLAAAIGFCSTAKPETLIVALRDAWLADADEKVRPGFAFAMCRFGTPFVVKEITNGVLSDRPDIVSDCAGLMDWIPIQLNDETRAAFDRLVELTRHENDRVRRSATRSLAAKAPQLLGPEFERLCTDKDKDVREACTLALRSNPDPKHADILFKLADDAEQTIRESAFSSIGNLKHSPSMKRLLPYLRDKKVQGYAVSALADMGGEDALPLMMSELEAGNDVGGMVYQHLRRLTGERFEEKPEPWLAWWKQKKLATLDERFPFLAQLSIPERDLPKGCVIAKVELPLQGATNGRVTTDPRAFVLISEEQTEPFKKHIKAAYYSVYREEGELGVFGWAFEDAAIAKDAHQRLTAEPSDRFRWWLSGQHVICLRRDQGVTDACFEAFEKLIEKRVADALTVPAQTKEHKAEPPKTRSQAEPGNENKMLGTLSGRFIFDGEPPVLKDPYERFANIDVNSTSVRPDAILDGAERTYRDFLTHGIRPKTADRSVLVGKDRGIANVVVWLVSKDVPWTRPAEELSPVSIRFKDGNASPRIAVVTVGQQLLIENHDPLTQTFAAEFSRALNPPASLTLPPSSADSPSSASLKFRVAEPFPAHYWFGRAPWASGRVLIHSNPFVAVSQPDGSFTLPNLPQGEWEFQVFHERGGHLSYWPKGRFKQEIKPGENSLGTIKVKPEQLSVLPIQDLVTAPLQNREQIGEVLGKPVYRDQIKDRGLQGLFFDPVRQDYRKTHQPEMTPTDAEMLFAAEYYERTIRERLKANGGEAALRERMEAIESQLAKGGLSEAEEQQLESEHSRLRNDLDVKKAATMMAAWSLTNWKGEKHLYDKFGGGRVLVGKMGHSAFDAGRRQMESLEAEGKFKITDPALRAQLFEQWTRDRGTFLKSDPEEIRRLLLEPEYVKPVGANNVRSDKVQKPSIPPKAKSESQGAIQKTSTQAALTPPTIAPSTTPVGDVFDGSVTTAESGYPVIKQISGEQSDGWIACEFGLQYRVRSEMTSLVAGELPLIFVDVRNRGTFKDMGLELHQSQHFVVAGGKRYERRDQPWAGVAPLEPEGKPLTLAFALSEDWKREGETKTPLKLSQGKHRIAPSLMIAPVYPSPDEPQTTPVSRKPIVQSLVCRPIEIEIRSGAWSGPPASLGLENIRREVIAIPDFHSPKVPANLQRLVLEHQPAAGEFLVKLIKSDDSGIQQAASVVFADAWDSMNREQIESYLLATMTHFVWQRSQYPLGVDAMIGMGPRYRPGYLGLPPDRKYSAETITTLKLDGVQVDQPIKYSGPGSLSHWVKTKDLSLGRHTLQLATKFTFTRGTETYRGEYDSPEFAFEMVSANTPDDLIAPHDEQLDHLVREALLFADTEYELDNPPGRVNFNRLPPEPPESEKWRPQIRWEGNKVGLSSLHCPVWKLAKRLPVDLCFAVEFHIENSATRIRCNDFVTLAVEGERWSYFSPHDFNAPAEMIKHADKDGFVTGRLVLKPSRAAALTDPKVKRYFDGEITSKPVRFKVVVSSNAPANQNR